MIDREDVCRTGEGMLGLTGAGTAIELGPVTIRSPRALTIAPRPRSGRKPARHVERATTVRMEDPWQGA